MEKNTYRHRAGCRSYSPTHALRHKQQLHAAIRLRTYEPQGCGDEPQGIGYEPQGFGYEPQGLGYEPEGLSYEPRGFAYEPQGFGYEAQGFGYEPQGFGYVWATRIWRLATMVRL